jgi:hypothetical protein
LLLSACGGNDGQSNPFLGKWTATPGSEGVIKCSDGASNVLDLAGDRVVISAGTGSDLLFRDEPEETCMRPMLDMVGTDRAEAPSGQKCTDSDGMTTSLTSMTIDLSSSKEMLEIHSMAGISYKDDAANEITCTAEAMATYRKP